MVSTTKKLPTPLTQQMVEQWLVDYLASLLDLDPDEIDIATTFDRHGLDSSSAIALTGDLSSWLGKELDPTIIYDYPTIESLATHVS